MILIDVLVIISIKYVLYIILYIDIEPDSEDLCENLQDLDLTWPEVESIWKKTTNFRLQYIKNNNTASIFKKWIQFTQPMGYKLVNIILYKLYSVKVTKTNVFSIYYL